MKLQQAVILAGGKGLRLQEKTKACPKGLLDVDGRPILDHIIYHLSLHGITEVIIAGGYRFNDFLVFADTKSRYGVNVNVVDTGLHTNNAGRILSLESNIMSEPFLLCWCDALSDINFTAMYQQHINSEAEVTLAAVHPPARFGDLVLKGNKVTSYAEKSKQTERWISGGYYVVNRSALSRITSSESSWEYDVLTAISSQQKLDAYRHSGNWQCMDTVYEHEYLNELAKNNKSFWPQPAN